MTADVPQSCGRVDERALVKVREQMRAGAREIILRRTREANYRVMVVADVTGDDEPPPCATRSSCC